MPGPDVEQAGSITRCSHAGSGRAPARIRPLLTVRTVPARVNDYVACVNAGIAKSVSRPAALHRDSDRHRVFGRAGHGADGAISRLRAHGHDHDRPRRCRSVGGLERRYQFRRSDAFGH